MGEREKLGGGREERDGRDIERDRERWGRDRDREGGKGVDPDTKVGGGTAYMSTQREVLEGETGSHRAKRANFGRGVRGSSRVKFQRPTWQMVQSTLFLS